MKNRILKTLLLKTLLLTTVAIPLFGLSVQAEEATVLGNGACVTEYQDRVLSAASGIPTLNTETDEVPVNDDEFSVQNYTGFYYSPYFEEYCYYVDGRSYTGTVIIDGEEYYYEGGSPYTGFKVDPADPYKIPISEHYQGEVGRRFYYKGKPADGFYTRSRWYGIYAEGLLSMDEMYEYVININRYAEKKEMRMEYYCFENGYGVFGLKEHNGEGRIYIDGAAISGGQGNDGGYVELRQQFDAQGIYDINAYYKDGQVFTGWYGGLYFQDGYRHSGNYCETGEMNLYNPHAYGHGEKPEYLEAGKTYFIQNGRVVESWYEADGKSYWYEHGIRQGYDPENASYRGKEIYDPDSDAWYWLDNVQQGAKAVNKDVYQESYAGAFADREDGTGKWVRYDAEGHMIKGWSMTDAGTYYFDPETGAMAKGNVTIDGESHYFDENTGILSAERTVDCVWINIDGKEYWYENGVRQGYDPSNPSYRGKEIYDPETGAWYWLDNVQQGAKAVNKDVYQESYAGAFADREDGTGKWVRYDENGQMVKGYVSVYICTDADGTEHLFTSQEAYRNEGYLQSHLRMQYFDPETGAMAKGEVELNGKLYYFNEITGIRERWLDEETGEWIHL